MSDKLICLVWGRFPGRSCELLVLLAIASACSDQGNCYIPVAVLAKSAGLSSSTAFAAIKGLRKERWIVTHRRLGRGGRLIFQMNISQLSRIKIRS